jgi:type VI secretion system secreted protein VgrG
VFADYQGQGQLAPAWRWDLADTSVYPQRSLCIQYGETDFDLVSRLLLEEGVFAWWEHSGAPGDAALGSHTLVLSDHNGAFAPNRQAKVRYTQSGAALKEDSLTRFKHSSQLLPASLNLASPDYRSLSLRPVSQAAGAGMPAPLAELQLSDVPGIYAYEDIAQGERLALRQMQAIDTQRRLTQATGTLRRAAPGTHWLFCEHPRHSGLSDAQDRFVTLAVSHSARNNLSADIKAKLQSLALTIARDKHPHDQAKGRLANDTEEPLYQCQINAQQLTTPVRPVTLDEHGLPDPLLLRRPSITGEQTAIVVGSGEPVHTDRDHRVKIQFHWQRGAGSSLRLNHPAQDNAPANDAAGTWVRVSERVAGANWGGNFLPRVGQEVLVSFVGGDIDRPVVVGSVYNGKGQDNAQGNQVSAGAANATGNANTWFPGTQAQGQLQAHQHTQVHTGFKTQELGTSQSGTGGYNQLVFDDSPAGQNRVELSSSTQATRLQLGHLLHQNDNQRLNPRGHGLDLTTAAWGAVRAGSGLIFAARAKPASTSAGQQMDGAEPASRLQQGQQIIHALADTMQAHNAKLPGEPEVKGAKQQDKAKQLQTEQGFYATQDSLKLSASHGSEGSDANAIQGGHGNAVQWARPDLVLDAVGGIYSFTPASHIAAAGATYAMVAGQDINRLAQGNYAIAATYGIVLGSYGKASNPNKPNQETGISLHAASGSVSTQSQSGATKIIADKNVSFASTTAMVRIVSPTKVLLAAGGAAITLESGKITLNGTGQALFKAGQKVFAGGAIANAPALSLPVPQELHFDPQGALSVRFAAQGNDDMAIQAGWGGQPYSVYSSGGELLAQGAVAQSGRIERTVVNAFERVVVEIGDPGQTEFAPAGNDPAPPHHTEPADAQAEVPADDATWDDPSKISPTDATFNASGNQARLHDTYLGDEKAHALLKQLGIDPTAAK